MFFYQFVCLKFCVKNKCPLVCGTTGLNAKQKKQLNEFARKNDVVYRENFSEGIHAFYQTAKDLKKQLKGWDVELIEIHRKGKKDVPSGTAEKLSGELQCDVKSLRMGTVFGTHTVVFCGNGETLTLTHQAENVSIFAKGAVDAAEQLVKKH